MCLAALVVAGADNNCVSKHVAPSLGRGDNSCEFRALQLQGFSKFNTQRGTTRIWFEQLKYLPVESN